MNFFLKNDSNDLYNTFDLLCLSTIFVIQQLQFFFKNVKKRGRDFTMFN